MNSSNIIDGLYDIIEKKRRTKLSNDDKTKILVILSDVDFKLFAGQAVEKILSVLSDIVIEELGERKEDLIVGKMGEGPVAGERGMAVNEKPDSVSSVDKVKDWLNKEIMVPEKSEGQYLTKIFNDGEGGEKETGSDKEDAEEVDVTSFLGIESINTLKIFLNPESMYTYNYLALDTNYRNQTEETGTSVSRFSWRYTSNINLVTGFCNSQRQISNVIAVRLYQPRVPYLGAMDTSSKRVSLLIEEFSAQSYILPNGRKFHYVLRPEYLKVVNGYVELTTEDYEDSIYKFRKPITEFASITLSFGDPANLLAWPTPVGRFLVCFEFICLKE